MSRSLWSTARRCVSTIFAPACAGCDGYASTSAAFCPICAPAAFESSPPHCACCAVPMDHFRDSRRTPASLCSRCHGTAPAFDRVWAKWEYEGAVSDAIRRIKYGADFPALRALFREALPWFSTLPLAHLADAMVVPVPSHRRELRRRGFHLPSLIADQLAPAFDGELAPHYLKKTRPTKPQAGLPVGARQRNVADAFLAPHSVDGGTAIIVDDVLTTGATADAASSRLISAGFDTIGVIVLARAPRHGAV